jgi:molecular chaperone DnaK
MTSIGIDFGRKNTVVAAVVRGEPKVLPNSQMDFVTPSAVGFHLGELLVGHDAVRYRRANPDSVVANVARLLSQSDERPSVQLEGKSFSPVELAAALFREIKHSAEIYLCAEVRRAVVAVPAWCSAKQQDNTRHAAATAGLDAVTLVYTTAAAVIAAAHAHAPSSPKKVLVYDMGASGCDVSIGRLDDSRFALLGQVHSQQIGGDRFDQYIMNRVLEYLQFHYRIDGCDDPRLPRGNCGTG